MAKKKGGLGRGLNSLLGESIEEIGDSSSTRDVSGEKEERNPETREAERPLVNEDAAGQAEKPAEKKAPVSDIIDPENDPKPLPYIEEDDHIQIKSIGFREPATAENEKETPAGGENEVRLADVFPNPDQPRTFFDKKELEELACSIKREGVLQPILVRSVGDGYQIIAGERRWQACKMLNLETVPVRILEADDNQAIELALVENTQRSDLNPIEEAYGYKRLMERNGMTQTEVAQAVSKGRSTIANSLRLLDLPEEAQKLLFEERITAGHARAILSIQSKEGRKKLTDKLASEKLSVREAESIARLLNGQRKAVAARGERTPTPEYFKKAAKKLRKSLNTNVRIKTVKGKNKVEIEFTDEEDLNRLVDGILAER